MGSLTVYKASAGSGKTFTLVAEYVALLLAGDPATAHREILAVTFTNKATAEMKERVLHELKHLAEATGENESGFEKKVSALLPRLSREELRHRAATALHAILHDYDHFHVTTIDSFFQSLLTAVAHELGLPAGFRVEIDDGRVVNLAADRLLDSVAEREDVRRWVLDYIHERISEDKSWDVSRDIKSLASQITNERFLAHEEKLLPLLADAQVVKDYVGALHALKASAATRLVEAAKQFDVTVNNVGGYDQFSYSTEIRNYIAKLATGVPVEPSDRMLRRMAGPEEWLRKPDLKKPALVAAASQLSSELAALEKTRVEETMLINTCDLTLRYISPLRLIGEVGREATGINHEESRFMLAKTPIFFNRMVGKEDASFVFERVGEQFRHIMIDEFQDTSRLQWENFKRLLVENMAQGNSCLLVGDVKQAIYRWRGGDWKILNGIEEAFKGQQDVKVDTLSTNFRSCERIVDFNNRLFKDAATLLDSLSEDKSLRDITTTYDDVRQDNCGKKDGHVEVELIIAEDKKKKSEERAAKSEEPVDLPGWDTPVSSSPDAATIDKDDERYVATRIAETIRLLHDKQGVAYSDIAILVRYNSEAAALLDQLSTIGAADLPIVSDEAFTLEASPAISLLIAALRYLDDETNDVARAYICRAQAQAATSPINKEEESADKEGASIDKESESAQPIPPAEQALTEDGSWGTSTLPAFLTGKARATLQRLPLYELVERLITLFHLDKDTAAPPYLFSLLDAVADAVESGRSTIAQLLEHWDETLHKQAIPAGEIDGVRILTIHKSKGLAFHTVLMPACDWKLEEDNMNDWMWCEPVAKPFNTLPIVPLHPVSTMQSSLYAADYATEHHDQRTENLNLMYVAFTRAKQNLYVWAHTHPRRLDEPQAKDRPKSITMGDILRACLGDDGYKSAEASTVHAPSAANKPSSTSDTTQPDDGVIPFASYAAHVEFRQSGAARDFVLTEDDEPALRGGGLQPADKQRASSEQSAYIDRGKLLHRVFSTIRTAADVAPALTTLAQSGLIASDKEMTSLRHLIEKRIAAPEVSAWFDGTWRVINECNILSRAADGTLLTRRPDRVMVRDDHAVVVDFKFGRPRPEYQEQVLTYCQLLIRMGYAHVEGYLWYVYDGQVQQVAK